MHQAPNQEHIKINVVRVKIRVILKFFIIIHVLTWRENDCEKKMDGNLCEFFSKDKKELIINK